MGTPPYSPIGPWSEHSDYSGTRTQGRGSDREQEEEQNLRHPWVAFGESSGNKQKSSDSQKSLFRTLDISKVHS